MDTGGHPGGAGACEVTQAHTGSSKQSDMAGWCVESAITKPPLLQESRLTGGGSPNLVDLVEWKSL